MEHKYVRHSELGFFIWPRTDNVWHSHIAQLAKRAGGTIISAGFAAFSDGLVVCHGRSESLDIGSLPDDSAELAKQLGIKAG